MQRGTMVWSWIALSSLVVGCVGTTAPASEVFTPAHVARVRGVRSAQISPDGSQVAYLLGVPRRPFVDDNGSAYAELHVVSTAGGEPRPFITGPVSIGSIGWTPDGRAISYLDKRGEDKHESLYIIPANGGESRKVLSHAASLSSYSWSPDSKQVAFLAREKEDKDDKKLKDQGFNAEVYEEGLHNTYVWIGDAHFGHPNDYPKDAKHRKLDLPGSATAVKWSPDGAHLAVTLARSPLVDDRYMFSKVNVVNVASGEIVSTLGTEGKIGAFDWSPNGEHVALISAENINDPAEGRLTVADARTGRMREVLGGFMGHVTSVQWQDDDSIMYLGDEGVWTGIGKVGRDGGTRKSILATGTHVLSGLTLSKDGQRAAFIGQSPTHPGEIMTMGHGDKAPTRLTDSNPWLKDMRFAKQEVVQYYARDKLPIEGLLIRPLDEKPGQRYPLILAVHGGPEAHERNGWLTHYSRPGQVGAAEGFAVFYPNYRGSTGRGVEFSKMGQSDYGGAEFDDLIDAIDHFVEQGLVDKDRVGVTGGSYGGFASAWCATKHTDRFKASVMFVGISDQVSKFGTTDIPNEMFYVHSRKWPWDDMEFFRERSPLTYVEQCRTPILIMHGKEDTRVHPSQSMELYRYLKTLGNVPVRLVFYPGEGHGNRKAAARLDYNMRLMRWMNHYLKGDGGDPPPHDLDYSAVKPDDDKDEEDDEDSDKG